jgi:RNA polymerase sigma factor for flagellar operon FliA
MAGAPLPNEPTGEALFESKLELVERVISFVSARHHLPGVEADDFGSHVKLKLIEDDYGILRKFQRRSSLRTFLTTVINHLFLDYRNAAWGKWRPSAEAKRAGEVAILLERLTGRDNYSFEEACELMETNHQVTVGRTELEVIAGRLPRRVKRRFESDEALAEVPSTQPALDDLIADRERAVIAVRVEVALRKAMAGLHAQDRLIFALRFHDGRSLVDIARALRLDQKALYRRVERLLRALQAELKVGGIDGEAALEIFGRAAVSIEWGSHTEGTVEPRPSEPKGEREWR